MEDHPMTQRNNGTAGASQRATILRMLRRRRTWVPMPTLAEAIGTYAVHIRVAQLRRLGHVIERQSKRNGRVVRSSYRLVEATP
jgi:hypothetical protein